MTHGDSTSWNLNLGVGYSQRSVVYSKSELTLNAVSVLRFEGRRLGFVLLRLGHIKTEFELKSL